ncbi:MAG TPA: acyl carrier protein [Gammaproteobacteria bacterium]|nr:acyl carrier protein [Gammaproteobacteria bacterium]
MHSKADIYDHLKNVIMELFETDPAAIRPEARLYEDLDIDSIDAVDMVIKLKDLTGKRMQPSDFKDVRTVQDVVEAVYVVLNER